MSAAPTFLLVARESTPERYATLSRDEKRQALRRLTDWLDDLTARGTLLQGQALGDERRVVSTPGRSAVTDGPFAEAKEMVGGFFLVRAADLDEATAIAQAWPNLEYGLTLEVRPLADCCHLARSLGWTTMREPVEA